MTLSPDEKQLYVTDGNLNLFRGDNARWDQSSTRCPLLIPTGWYPNSVSFNSDGSRVYVINGKSPTGANTELLL